MALPRFTTPGSESVIGKASPFGPYTMSSSNHHCGVGRLKSVPVEYQCVGSRTITSPDRGQLTESFAQPPPAATHTALGQS